jgi:hypothetical protein
MKIDFHDTSKLMQDAVTEILWEYHQYRIETDERYKELNDLLGGLDRDYMMMNITQYLYDKYNLVVTEHKGYRVEISYSEAGVERSKKTTPEIQGLSITQTGLTDEEVKQKVLQIAAQISDERAVDK